MKIQINPKYTKQLFYHKSGRLKYVSDTWHSYTFWLVVILGGFLWHGWSLAFNMKATLFTLLGDMQLGWHLPPPHVNGIFGRSYWYGWYPLLIASNWCLVYLIGQLLLVLVFILFGMGSIDLRCYMTVNSWIALWMPSSTLSSRRALNFMSSTLAPPHHGWQGLSKQQGDVAFGGTSTCDDV